MQFWTVDLEWPNVFCKITCVYWSLYFMGDIIQQSIRKGWIMTKDQHFPETLLFTVTESSFCLKLLFIKSKAKICWKSCHTCIIQQQALCAYWNWLHQRFIHIVTNHFKEREDTFVTKMKEIHSEKKNTDLEYNYKHTHAMYSVQRYLWPGDLMSMFKYSKTAVWKTAVFFLSVVLQNVN